MVMWLECLEMRWYPVAAAKRVRITCRQPIKMPNILSLKDWFLEKAE